MTGASRAPRLYSIPAGTAFLSEFVSALLAQKIVPGFPDPDDPLALSTARIFVPTRRAALALASEIARQQSARSALLPQILPLGALGDSEDASLFDPVDYAALTVEGTALTAGKLERRLKLSELILEWGRAIRGAICAFDPDAGMQTDEDESFNVTRAPGQAFHLAGELGGLIDEMIIEGIDWKALHTLAPDTFDRYWSITLDFLKIVMEAWPAHLAETGRVDEARRYADLAQAEAQRLLQQKPREPMIVAGSTGTNASTAKLIAAIAQLPNGAVVLPGLDHGLDDASWNILAKLDDRSDGKRNANGAAGHPQAALARLLGRLKVVRADVKQLARDAPSVAARMNFLTQALRPAETAEGWKDYREALGASGPAEALAGVTFVNAEAERQEAVAIAIAMREVIETPDRTAALITPDRAIARRVRSELQRWDIIVVDSGGDSLNNKPAGMLARLALQLAQRDDDPGTTIALLNHSGLRLGYSRAQLADIASLVETGVLRGPALALSQVEESLGKARMRAEDKYAHPAKKGIGDEDWIAIAAFLHKLREALQPLRALSGEKSLKTFFARHKEVVAALTVCAEDEDATAGDDYAALEQVFDGFAAAPDTKFDLSLAEYAALFDAVASEARVRGPHNAHPRLKILGLLEARLLPADVKILAGMDESVWPPAAKTDAFLNRPMRDQLGLTPPERRIGQTAHDFVEAMGAQKVIITRARKRGGSPSIPSRLVQRMRALAGDGWAACEARGDALLAYALALDDPPSVQPVTRPEPKPVLDLRPQKLSVTQIETWRRDPYSIYAQKILNLAPLDEAGTETNAADIGNGLHTAIAQYSQAVHKSESREQAQARMDAIAADVFAYLLVDVNFRTFNWPRIQVSLREFVQWDKERQQDVARLLTERDGLCELTLCDGSIFTLTARADRIERTASGNAVIVDYKSGKVPTVREVNAGFAPQMTLEAAIVKAGGFEGFPKDTSVAEAIYVKLLSKDGIDPSSVGKRRDEKPLDQLQAEHLAGLLQLANSFRSHDTAYIPRPYPQFEQAYGKYDHLARVKEWIANSDGEPE